MYKNLLILIITFITPENPGMIGIMGLGAAYLAIGLANRDKWKTEG